MPVQADSLLEGIQIKNIQALQNLSDYNLAGVLGGTIAYKGTRTSNIADGDISILNCIVELKTPFFNLKDLTFTQIDSKITLHNLQNLQIKETILKGSQAGGSISGTVTLKNPYEKSILNLSGTINPHPALIAKLGAMASLFLKQKQGSSGFPFKITGTLEKPDFSLK
ncbi:type II secretion system protein GspN [Desulfonema limicola]|uniref:type II secretion system protein GspN n=1 Tax=Desulfonema limicola TaxID=45656 RepID=UPI001A9B0DFA